MSSNMNNFDDFLRQQFQPQDYVDDAGFSAQVMANLPAPKRLNPWLEKLIVALPVTLIAFFVLSQLQWRALVQPVYAWLLLLDITSLISIAAAMFLTLLAMTVALLLRRAD